MENKELLAKAIDEFLISEYENESNYDEILEKINNGEEINLATTNAEYDDDMEFEATLVTKDEKYKIEYSVNEEVVNEEEYKIDELINVLKYTSFEELTGDENFPGYSKYEFEDE